MATEKKEIKSLKSDETVYVAFQNRSPRNVTLYWHDYSGKLVRYAVIKSGGIYSIDTFVTHPWSVSDSKTGDRLFVDNQFVFFPKVQPQEGDEPRYDRFFIELPVYPLLIRCLQVIRKKIPKNEMDRLHIPDNLKHALKYVPDLKCSTYERFSIIDHDQS
ncbi:von Hippel-Lindau disease tumor supressor [Mytilus galloprovincialis]|uniref:von Hippel-Lindau disease tumor supressor n=1 Tax=Mytilus galloprovincialis TaxID=29158 RepID=A0A8B6BKD6_MYTGA|nr:von Hippel-Lindau disease tumor supressor [Mytilus galloprovincialis]